jgi:drug/metabolite transporter (DMT)-like permease
MGVLLAVLSAVGYGLSDFIAGLVSRRTSAWSVAFVAGVASALCTAVVAMFPAGDPVGRDFAWASLAGAGGGVGTVFLYRGLAIGRMSVVAPISAVGAAVVPVVVGAASGERPGPVVWLGVASALPGIWLVSTSGPSGTQTGSVAEGVLDGMLAGLGFGVLFAAIGQVPDTAGMWPLALAQVVSTVAVVALAVALRADWVPHERATWWGALAGPLGAGAAIAFLLSTQHGYLTVAGVIASLYPSATVLLAATVLHERIHRVQGLGLVLCALAVALVATG